MLDYLTFREILNKHIFGNEKREILKAIAFHPERFTGLFRPSKPGIKILQFLFQSHEIRFGNAIEEVVEEILRDLGYKILQKDIIIKENEEEETLSFDQLFTDGNKYFFVEQKVRDDHDSTKKRGQIRNFERKLEILINNYGSKVIGIMYFIDPNFTKNKNYYENELKNMSKKYSTPLYLFYGKEFFEFFGKPDYWDALINYLQKWKEELPEVPEINFDKNPLKSFEEIKDLEIICWRRLLENDKLWKEGVMKTIFKTGETLNLLLNFFKSQNLQQYQYIYKLLEKRIKENYP